MQSDLKCENNNCETPFQNVALRWCQCIDINRVKTGAELEYSCELCYIRDEAQWEELTRDNE